MNEINGVPKTSMSNEELILLCERLERELIQAEAVNQAYKKHLEQVIEYNSVERYRAVIQKNREAAATASH